MRILPISDFGPRDGRKAVTGVMAAARPMVGRVLGGARSEVLAARAN